MERIGARLYIGAAALLFSTGGAAIKLSTLSSWQIAGLRSGIAALVLAALIPSWRKIDLRVLPVGVAFAATMILFVTANTLTTAANAIFLQTTAPLYVLLMGPMLLGEPRQRADLPVVALLGVGALFFFVGSETPLDTAPNPVAGNLVGAASGVTWSLTVIGLRWLARDAHDANTVTPATVRRDPAGAAVLVGNVLAFAVCLPFAVPFSGAVAADWMVIVYLGVFQIGLAYVCLVRGVRSARALDVALLLVLEPVLSTLLAWAVHREVPGAWAALGCAVILAGLLFQASQTRKTAA